MKKNRLYLHYLCSKAIWKQRKADKNKIIELDRVAQYLAAQHSKFIIQTIDSKAKLFDQHYLEIFHPNIPASVLLCAWHIGNICEEKRIDKLSRLDKHSPSASLLAVSATF